MDKLVCGATAVLFMLSLPVLAEDEMTLSPNTITINSKRPELALDDAQRKAIAAALETENTEQKTPSNFQPEIGAAIPLTMTLDVMPQTLIQRQPSLAQYGYAKLARDVLVIDPMKKTIIAVLQRQSPTSGSDMTPTSWAASRGRELTGQAPQSANGASTPEPAGDSGDKKNGTEATPAEN